jgi:hypothetical protein
VTLARHCEVRSLRRTFTSLSEHFRHRNGGIDRDGENGEGAASLAHIRGLDADDLPHTAAMIAPCAAISQIFFGCAATTLHVTVALLPPSPTIVKLRVDRSRLFRNLPDLQLIATDEICAEKI